MSALLPKQKFLPRGGGGKVSLQGLWMTRCEARIREQRMGRVEVEARWSPCYLLFHS